jgi:perosamine synthetase
MMAALGDAGIGTRTFFYGLHQQPALLARGMTSIALPVTESLSERGFYLPSGLGLSQDDQARVIDVVTRFATHV